MNDITPQDDWGQALRHGGQDDTEGRHRPKKRPFLWGLALLPALGLFVWALWFHTPLLPVRMDTTVTFVDSSSGMLHFRVDTPKVLFAGVVVIDQGEVWQASDIRAQADATDFTVNVPALTAEAAASMQVRPFYWTDGYLGTGEAMTLPTLNATLVADNSITVTQTPLMTGEVLVHLECLLADLDAKQVYAVGFTMASGAGEQYAVGEPSIISAQATHTLVADITLADGDYICRAYAFSLTGNDSMMGQPQRFAVQWTSLSQTNPPALSTGSAQQTVAKATAATIPITPSPATAFTAKPSPTKTASSLGGLPSQPVSVAMPRATLFSLYDVSTRFYFHQLTNTQKMLFSELYDALADFRATVTLSGSYVEADLKPALDVLRFDCPELFFLNRQETSYRTSADRLVDVAFTLTMNQTDYEAELTRVMKEISALAQLPGFGNDAYSHELAIYREIIRRNQYMLDQPFGSEGNAVWLLGYGECDGFTRGLHLALRYYGIPCGEVVGRTYDNGVISPVAHMWSYVCIDSVWYQCDATWDNGFAQAIPDKVLATECLPFFNIDDAMMMSARTRSTESLIGWQLPICDSMTDNYYNRKGLRIPTGADLQAVLHERLTLTYREQATGVVLPFSSGADISTALVRLSDILAQWRYQGARIEQYQYSYQIECNLLCLNGIQFSQ